MSEGGDSVETDPLEFDGGWFSRGSFQFLRLGSDVQITKLERRNRTF